MNKNKDILKAMKKTKSTLEEAKAFSVPVKFDSKNVVIKLPKKFASYLKLQKDSNINIIPINNSLQITTSKMLTLIPALDLNDLENQFIDQN